jgi:hypothetical protein
MADPLRFHPLVASDLRDAIGWYDGISVGLGNRFRMLVDSRFDDIAERPESFPHAFDDVRFARVQRFPYLILFRETQDVIHVLGVFHGASDPGKWRQRASDP